MDFLFPLLIVILFPCPVIGFTAVIIAQSERWLASLAAGLAGLFPLYAVFGGSRGQDGIAILASPILFLIAALCFLLNQPTKREKSAGIISGVGFVVSLIVMAALNVSIPYS